MTKSKKSKNENKSANIDNKAILTKNLEKKEEKVKVVEKTTKIDKLLTKISNFEEIKTEYDLIEDNLTPILVLHKMSETLELYIKIIQQILQPEEFHSMYECGMFDDEDKRKLLVLYRKIMFIHRDILKAEILNVDTDLASLIPIIHKEIIEFKPVIVKIVIKMQKAWESNSKDLLKDKSMHYFG